jgi:hypothetical protein
MKRKPAAKALGALPELTRVHPAPFEIRSPETSDDDLA